MTMTTEQNKNVRIGVVDGDGGEGEVTVEELTAMKNEAREVAKGATYNINERRFASEETRFCIWEGQSADGRKHAETIGKSAFPFEGASDGRIRLADMIVNERVLVLVAAAVRNLPRVKGLELAHEGLGHKLTTVLKWVLKNVLGAEYVRAVTQVAQYQEGDAPSGGMLGVWWEQQTALELREVTLGELRTVAAAMLGVPLEASNLNPQASGNNQGPNDQGPAGQGPVQTYGQDTLKGGHPTAEMARRAQVVAELGQRFNEWWAQVEVRLLNPRQDGETAQLLQRVLPHLTAKRARKMVGELRASGVAEYPAPYVRRDGVRVCAYRIFEDVFFPTNTTSVREGRCFFVREWLTEVALRERGVSGGYSEEFIEGCLGQEGMSGWPVYRRNPTQGDFMVVKSEESKEAYRGLYEVNTVYYVACNEDGVPGIYYYPFHFHVEVAGHERRILEYAHGEYPLTYFARETLGRRLLDARGVPELVATEQEALKLLHDSFNDNVNLATVPPIKVPRRRSKLSLVIGPLKVIKEDRPGDVSWMEPPQYPAGNEKQQERIMRRVNEYFGRLDNELPNLLTQMHQTGMVLQFLTSLSGVLTQVLQLCQQYLDEETLGQITGEDGIPVAHSREEIQGKFAVELSFDPRDLDLEYLKTLADVLTKMILPADTQGTVQRDKLIQRLFMAIDPGLAVGTLRPVEAASASEVADEEKNFALISSGVEPAMVAEGMNFPLRLQVLTGIVQKNPEAYGKMSPVSREIFGARLKYLENQVQQLRNAQIGRQVGQPALGQGAMAGISGAMGQGMGMHQGPPGAGQRQLGMGAHLPVGQPGVSGMGRGMSE